MQINEINAVLRDIFNDLINDGYKKSNICSFTLGESNVPQFDSFMKGTDFGIKPLQRMINNRGFQFQIIISPKNETDIVKFVEDVNNTTLRIFKEKMIETLDNENSVKVASIPKTGVIAEVSSELFNEIIK